MHTGSRLKPLCIVESSALHTFLEWRQYDVFTCKRYVLYSKQLPITIMKYKEKLLIYWLIWFGSSFDCNEANMHTYIGSTYIGNTLLVWYCIKWLWTYFRDHEININFADYFNFEIHFCWKEFHTLKSIIHKVLYTDAVAHFLILLVGTHQPFVELIESKHQFKSTHSIQLLTIWYLGIRESEVLQFTTINEVALSFCE